MPQTVKEKKPTAVACRRCSQWESGPEDLFCSFCGSLLIGLELTPEEVILIPVHQADRAELRLSNRGSEDLPIVILPANEAIPGVDFGKGEMVLAKGKTVSLSLSLNRADLPSSFSQLSAQYLCTVDGDRRRAARFRVIVKEGPRPVLKTTKLDFGRIEEGTVAERSLRIGNTGSAPAILKKVLCEGSGQLRLAESPEKRLPTIKPGEEISLRVAWDGKQEETEGKSKKAGFRLLFEGLDESLFAPATAQVFRRSLQLTPPALVWEPALAGHDLGQRVRLVNTGTVDVEIQGLEVESDWIEVVPEGDLPITLVGEATGNRGTVHRTWQFWAILDTSRLPAGKHETEIRLRTAEGSISLPVRAQVVEPEPYREYVGIDFGTTNSVMVFSAVGPQQELELVKVVHDGAREGDPLVPSVLVFEAGGRWYEIGRRAQAEAGSAADRSVRSIKRVMGSGSEHEFFGRKYKPEEIASLIIRRLTEMAELYFYRRHGRYCKIRRAIVTVPVNFFGPQIRGILRACQLAGLEVEGLNGEGELPADETATSHGMVLDEPAAAALFYLSSLARQRDGKLKKLQEKLGRESGLRLLIYDHGGGTLDVSVVHLQRREDGTAVMRILASLGDNRVGGDSFDLRLMERLAERCKAENETFAEWMILGSFHMIEERKQREGWSTEAWTQLLTARSEWKDAAERAKITLSTKKEAKISIAAHHILREHPDGMGRFSHADRAFRTEVTRADFDGAVGDLLQESEELVRRVFALAAFEPSDIDFVFHTGRQSLTPGVRTRISQVVPEPTEQVLDEENLKICVAKGAAVYGRMRTSAGGIEVIDGGRRLPHSYGLQKSGFFGERLFQEVIAKGDEYPVSKEVPYQIKATAEHALIRVYQNRGADGVLDDNREARCVGMVEVGSDSARDEEVVVRLAVDGNRNISVSLNGHEVELQPWAWAEEEENWAW